MTQERKSRRREMPHPVDVYVGNRVKELRILRGHSQTALGKALDLTFQQVQKYERGTNRISCSKLNEIANFLDVQISYFFSGLNGEDDITVDTTELDRRALFMIRMFNNAPENVKSAVLDMLKVVSEATAANDGGDLGDMVA